MIKNNKIQQKEIIINNLRISYCERYSKKNNDDINSIKKITLFLHGWGSNKESFTRLFSLKENFISLDFPAFGKSSKLKKSYTLQDYSDFLHTFLEKVAVNRNKNIHIEFVVHSFGGRVLLKYLENKSKNIYINNLNIQNIVCIGVPFYRNLTKIQKLQIKFSEFLNKNKYTKYFKQAISPIFTKLFNNKDSDYLALSDNIMKKTFQNIVNEDVSIYLDNFKKYEENLTLIWGEKDESAPLYYAKNVHEKYPKSKLFIIKNAGHFPWIDNIEEFKKFL